MTSKNKTKLGKNPFEKASAPKRKKTAPQTTSATSQAEVLKTESTPGQSRNRTQSRPEAHPRGHQWRLERFAFFRFENFGETTPSLSLLSVAVKLPFWKRPRNHFEFKILSRPISLNLVSLRIQQA